MKKFTLTLIGILLIISFALTACGSASGSEVPAPVANEEPAATIEAPTATEAPAVGSKSSERTPPMLHIAMTKGQVEVRNTVDGQFAPVQAGQKLGVGAEIRTGAGSVVALYRDTLSMVILDQNSVMLVKKLAFEVSKPVTILALINGAASVDHKGKLPEGAVLAIETPNKQQSGVIGSTVRVSFNTSVTPPVMTATCISGECNFVKGDQTLSLKEGQQVDVAGMTPLPGMPNVMEISTEQANGFLAQAHAACGCDLPISEIKDTGLTTLVPPSDDVPTPEEDLQNSADENGNTNPDTDEMPSEQIDQVTNEVMEEPVATDEPSSDQPATEAPAP